MGFIEREYMQRENRVNQLKSCCETIIDNAEKIMEGYDLNRNTTIVIDFPCNEVPTITVSNEFISQKMADSWMK